MRHIRIITFHNGSNYGAALQAYALQEIVREQYEDVKIINYQNRFIMKGLDKIRFGLSLHGLFFCVTDVLSYASNSGKINRFKSFFEKYYMLTDLIDASQLINRNHNIDVGISGSDQIWNPLLQGKLDKVYFLQIPGVRKKISYASSFGSYDFTNVSINAELRRYLQEYQAVSVRENAEKAEKMIGVKVKNACDPTLLFDKEMWRKRFVLQENTKDYLLVYAMTDIEVIMQYAKKISKERDLKIVYLGSCLTRHKGVEYVADAGPIEFVQLLYSAAYIVTNSFHGTAFAVNFSKQFVSVRNPKNPERASFFLKQIQLEDHICTNLNDIPEDIDEARYDVIQKKLNHIRRESIKFLLDNIG